MRIWYGGNLGGLLQSEERSRLEAILPRLFGYHLLHVGYFGDCGHLATSPIRHCVTLDADDQLGYGAGLYGLPSALPVATDCVDVVILHHTLELDTDPHQVLREAERVLIPEGHLVVVGFNPWSLWGLRKLFSGWRGEMPWSCRFLRLARLKDWLALLGFDVVDMQNFFFRPPVSSEGVLKKLNFLETLGRRVWPRLSGAYILVARKRVMTLTPIRPRWRRQRRLVGAGLAETSNRGMYKK